MERVVYCTARVSGSRDPSSAADQNVYIRALAAHNVLQQEVDAAVVVSNDSDLKLPVKEIRKQVPVGIVNPGPAQLAGDLKGKPSDGVGEHWWGRLTESQYRDHQLPDSVDGITKPNAW